MPSVEIVIPVKNPGPVFRSVIRSWLEQSVDGQYSFSVCIVDDGSERHEDVNLVVSGIASRAGLRVIRHEASLGRGPAINAGAFSSEADYLVILDADCRAHSVDTLSRLLAHLGGQESLLCGKLLSEGYGFWSRYFNNVVLEREVKFKKGDMLAFSTQFCLISRSAYLISRGFDAAYSRYGFEDRDWVVRLIGQGLEVRYVPDSAVYHDDDICLGRVCTKMFEAGRYTSGVFKRRHARQYEALIYSQVDAEAVSAAKAIALDFLSFFRRYLLIFSEWLIAIPLPFVVKRFLVKFVSGLYYFAGTRARERDVAQS